MTGKEFLGLWALALGGTAVVAGWIWVATTLVHSAWLAGVVGLVPTLGLVTIGMWLVVRR